MTELPQLYLQTISNFNPFESDPHRVLFASVRCAFPPSPYFDETNELRYDIAMRLSMGYPVPDVRFVFDDMILYQDWEDFYEEPQPDDIGEVIAEYNRLIPEKSEDAVKLEKFADELEKQGVVYTFRKGYDTFEAAHDDYVEASQKNAEGYSYSHEQDVARLVHTGDLYIGYGSVDEGDDHEEKSVAVAQKIVDALRSVGFEPEWGGTFEERILVKGLVYEVPVSEG